jgi:hypothetical protein
VGNWLGHSLAEAPPAPSAEVSRIDIDGEPKAEKSKSDNEQNSDIDEDEIEWEPEEPGRARSLSPPGKRKGQLGKCA